MVLGGLSIAFGFDTYRVVGLSMEPSLQDGEYIIVEKLSYAFRSPRRGEIVVFSEPQDPSSEYIKRLVAIPGDTIEVVDDHLSINRMLLEEPYLATPATAPFTPCSLEKDAYFAVGDNRMLSRDSRNFGPIPRKAIKGRAWFVFNPAGHLGFAPHALSSWSKPVRDK